jgi:hypothetical protein
MTEGVLDWRPVVGHEDFYEVSDYGHVKRTKRVKGARVGRCLHPAWNLKPTTQRAATPAVNADPV